MYALLAKSRKFNLPVDLQMELFDCLVVPILTYGCEVWGFKYTNLIEKLHLKFMKFVLSVKSSTCNSMVYGELGRFPLLVRVKKQIVAYWAKTLQGRDRKLSYKMLNHLSALHSRQEFSSPWLMFVKSVLDQCGLSNVWTDPTAHSIEWIKLKLDRTLKDQFLQEWRHDLNSKSSCDFYLNLKDNFELERYLKLSNQSYRKAICRLRTSNNRLPKVTGRYTNIPRAERFCHLCPGNNLGDEYHLIAECHNDNLVKLRQEHVPLSVYRRPSVHKCLQWLRSTNSRDVKALGRFLKEALQLY